MPAQAGGCPQESGDCAIANVRALLDVQTRSQALVPGGHHIHNQQISGSATVHNGDIYNFVLPGDVAKEAANLSSTIAEAEMACKALYELIGRMQNVSVDMQLLSRDLDDIYTVAGTLHAYLNDNDFAESVIWAALSGNLAEVVTSSLSIFEDIKTRVKDIDPFGKGDLNTIARGGKEPSRPGLGKDEVDGLRKCLNSHKITMNIAISMASLYQSQMTRVEMRDYHTRLERLLQAIEDEKAAQLPPAQSHRAIDRSAVRFDKTYALRHYLSSAASVLSEATMRPTPSMQISSYIESESFGESQSYVTAPTAIGVVNAARCSQIFIAGLPNKKTVILQVTSLQTIESVKKEVGQKLGLNRSAFQLTYQSRVLRTANATLESYNVPHEATLTCVSFRPDKMQPGVWYQAPYFTIVFSTGFSLEVPTEGLTTIRDVKLYIGKNEGTHREQLRLIYRGKELSDDERLTSSTFELTGGLIVLHALVRLSRPDNPQLRYINHIRNRPAPPQGKPRQPKSQSITRVPDLETLEEVSTIGGSKEDSIASPEGYSDNIREIDYDPSVNDVDRKGVTLRRNYFNLRWFRKLKE